MDRRDSVRTTLSPMAMGKRQRHAKQVSMSVATRDLPRSDAHPFYARLNQILDQQDFDGFVEDGAARPFDDLADTRLIDLETHEAVFTWILQRLADAGLVKGKTVGIDATTLEANAALCSIVRRDTGETTGC
jgi:hypothetical protein